MVRTDKKVPQAMGAGGSGAGLGQGLGRGTRGGVAPCSAAPATVPPVSASAVISVRAAWAGPDQASPSGEVQVTACCAPLRPTMPAAVKPLGVAVSAVIRPRPSGAWSTTCRHWPPPSAETTTTGISPARVAAYPPATTLAPLATTELNVALSPPAGGDTESKRQRWPSGETQIA